MTSAPQASQPVPSSSTAPKGHREIDPVEVGWQFVPQYYTFVNKSPNRLHCFYTANSTFCHGTEGEDSKPCHGQRDIHEKIMSLGYDNCKVYINSVDAQSSSQNGILIQVIGEISNRGEPWKKFVQTFFLAEQPNGYFVLNDIFRFLREPDVEEEEEEQEGEINEDAVVIAVAAPTKEEVPAEQPTKPIVPVEEVVNAYELEAPKPQVAVAAPPPVEREVTPEPEAKASTHVNGVNGTTDHHPDTSTEHTAPLVEPQPEPVTTVLEQSPILPVAELPAPIKVPSPAPQPTPPPQQARVQASTPPVPSGPKTWASLAATNNKKWGSAIASDAKGVSAAAPNTSPAPSPVQKGPQGGGRVFGNENAQTPISVTSAACFVKGVTDNVTETMMRDALQTRFGPIKEIEIVRSKACAFLEFQTVDAARRAIAFCLPTNQGGEGGIRLEGKPGPNNLPPRIVVETRKERGDRPPPRTRGPGPSNEGGSGGGRGMAIGMQPGEGRGSGRGGRGGDGPRGRGTGTAAK